MRRFYLIAFLAGAMIAGPLGYLIHKPAAAPAPIPQAVIADDEQVGPEMPASVPAVKVAKSAAPIGVHFSPSGGCTDAVVAELDGAKKTVDVQAYSFTSAPIAKAIIDAKNRGVAVRVILDKSNQTAKYSAATFLLNGGVPTWIDPKHAIAHNKIMLIDGQTILTGSFNFTAAAEKSNAENLLIIRGNGSLIVEYQKNFAAHLGHSQVYRGVDK